MTTTQSGANLPAVKKVDVLKNVLNAPSVMEQFKNALDKNASSFVASVIDMYNGDLTLQRCEPKAVVMEALKAAVLKLPVNKSLGFSYIIAYNNSVKNANGGWDKVMQPTFQIGYKGYIQLAMRTGQYRTINADKVFEGELRQVNKLTGEIDFQGEKKSDKVVGYFAYIEMINGFSKTMYRSVEEVTAHAKRFSKSYGSKSSPWVTDFDAMALKTVLSNLLSHYGFLSVEMMGAYEADSVDNNNEQKYDADLSDNANKTIVNFEEAEVVQEAIAETATETTEDGIAPNPSF